MAKIIIKRILEAFKGRFFLILWISLVTFLFYDSFMYYKDGRQFYYLRKILGFGLCVSRGTAAVINICSALILLPMCKKLNQILFKVMAKACPRLFFFWLERTKSFHMTIAITLFLFGVAHSVSHFVNLCNFSRNYDESRPEVNLITSKNENPLVLLLSQPGWTGLSMLIITTAMSITSQRMIRRRIYNAFWYTHQLYLPFMVLLIIHPLSGVLKEEVLDINGPKNNSSQIANSSLVTTPKFVSIKSTTWQWVVFPMTCFIIDLIWRVFERNRASVDILKVNMMAGRIIGLTLSCPHEGFKCRPGQYVLLQCPRISLLEWHPFTVVKVPTAVEREFAVWIKVTGDWTEALENLLLEESSDNVSLLVDGPMVSPMERAGASGGVVVCVAAGVGVTPFVPILHQLLSNPRSDTPKRVHLMWIVRSEHEAAALGDLATQCFKELRDTNRPDRLQIQIHITGNNNAAITTTQTMVNEKGVTFVVNNENVNLLTQNITEKIIADCKGYSLANEYPVLACRLKRGRPYWEKVFGYWVHLYPNAHLTLFCCGPKKLVKTLRDKSQRVSLNTKTKITFIHERFS